MEPKPPSWRQVVPLLRQIYARHCAGCCLHVVIDDCNPEQCFIDHAADRARQNGHQDCLAAAVVLQAMSQTQRKKAARGWWIGLEEHNGQV